MVQYQLGLKKAGWHEVQPVVTDFKVWHNSSLDRVTKYISEMMITDNRLQLNTKLSHLHPSIQA
jgi:hypothetical protein